jgi:hypothetical protein
MEEDYIKYIFTIKFINKHDIEVIVDKVNEKICRYKCIDNFLYQTKDGFVFKKSTYFALTENQCTLPSNFKKYVHLVMWKSELKFNTDYGRKIFLKNFKKNLEEFSNCVLFEKNNTPNENKVAFLKNNWIVY